MTKIHTEAEPLLCLKCAWRQDCQKKFSFTGGHCPEFSKDVTVKETKTEK